MTSQPETEGMYSYRYRDTLLILKMTSRILVGFIILSPIFLLRYGRRSTMELLTEGVKAILLFGIMMGLIVFFYLFIFFYFVDKPLLFPEGHPLVSRNIRIIRFKHNSSFQSTSPHLIPSSALQIRLFIPKSSLGMAINHYFPCPIFFPQETGIKGKILNSVEIPIPFNARNNEFFRCPGLFKTRNSLGQRVRGDIYIRVRVIRSLHYYLAWTLIILVGFILFISILVFLQSQGFFS
jgi:hypothetical protein